MCLANENGCVCLRARGAPSPAAGLQAGVDPCCSSRGVCNPVVWTDPPDGDPALKKQRLQDMERMPLVRLLGKRGLFEAA